MSVTKTYVVEDCLKTYMSTYFNEYRADNTDRATFNLTLPSTFKIEYELLITQSTKNSSFLIIGETASKGLLVGKVGSGDSVWKIYARNGTDVITTGSNIPVGNDWIPITLSFDGTTFNFNNDISVTNFNGISLNSLVQALSYKNGSTSGQLRNIKIKPL